MNMVAYRLPIFSPGIALERQSKPPWIRTVRVHVKKPRTTTTEQK